MNILHLALSRRSERVSACLRRWLVSTLLLGWALLGVSAQGQTLTGVEALIARQLPSLKGRVTLRTLPQGLSSREAFRLSTPGGKELLIEATSPSAASRALMHYLQQYCHMSISHYGNNLRPIQTLVALPQPVLVETPFSYRYALNYCTYNYSYSFYQWSDWERELDWMALSGVNLMLAPLGTEAIWQEALRSVGYSEAEIQQFIPGVGYNAWWLMGNLEGWGGPMSQPLIDYRMDLQKKILKRMQELGITPVLQGFFGMVPHSLKAKYPDAPIVEQGKWGRFVRPSVLLPGNALFDRLSSAYYASLKKHLGADVKFFGGDLFHEGGKKEGINVGEVAGLIQKTMLKHFPGATWVLQGWSNNPPQQLIDGLAKEHTLIVNLAGEITSTWEATREFGRTPWIWGSVNHFGGKTDMGGQLPVVVGEPHRALKQSEGGLVRGLGILPEGIHTNPVVYDLALETAWHREAPSLDSLLSSYVRYRYGSWDARVYEAWQLLASSIYGEFKIKGEGTFESIFCARPAMDIKNVSTWGPKQMQYDVRKLERALLLLRSAADHYQGSETYHYDLVDLARQVLTNHARDVYNESLRAFRAQDKELLLERSAKFMALLELQDDLVGTVPDLLLGRWLQAASQYGPTAADRKRSLWNAKTLITYWGPDDATTPVHDYANKEWAGLLRSYYLPRWRVFYADLKAQLEGAAPQAIDYYQMERAWTEREETFPTQARGNYLTYVDRVIQETYRPYRDAALSPSERTTDLLGRMTLEEKLAQMRHIHFKHYNEGGAVDLQKLQSSLTKGMSFGAFEAFPYTSGQYLKAVSVIQKHMREETRLGIPVIPLMEGLHGVVQAGSTIFPQSIAQAATFNPELVQAMGAHIGREMKAIGAKQALAPDLDIARELRWGRVEETYGEDPYLIGIMGKNYVQGLQREGIIPTLKHFVAHGTPTGGLNLASVRGGQRELLDVYAKPFAYVIKQTGALSVMNCYSSYDHEPITSSPYFLTSLLRDSLGFRGYVYADWGSVPMLKYFHRTASSDQEAARQAITAGVDLEASSDYYRHALEMVRTGQLDSSYIDRAAYNVLYTKFASGLFDEALPDTVRWREQMHSPAAVATAAALADESIVLLENREGFLPLKRERLKRIAVIGPNADQVQFGDYSWTQDNQHGVTPLAGLKELLEGTPIQVQYAPGCDLYSQDERQIRSAVQLAKKSDVAIVVVGTQSALLARPTKPATSGEGYDLSDLELPGVQRKLIEELSKTGKPVVVVLVTGRPLVVEAFKDKVSALLVQWYGGEEAGRSLAKVLFGEVNPSGRLPVSFPQSVGHLPCYYNYLPTDKGYYNKKGSLQSPGRDYVFSSPHSAYPFGYGLSYSDFSYSGLSIPHRTLGTQDTLRLSFTVRNISNRQGQDVPQLYIRDLVSSVATPIKQLYRFQKITLPGGAEQRLTFDVPLSELTLHDQAMRSVVEPGQFELQVGSSSRDILLSDTITVVASEAPQGSAQHGSGQHTASVKSRSGVALTAQGTVRDVQASVMPGVTVTSRATGARATTDAQGRYSLATYEGDELLFTLRGYQTTTLTVRRGGLYDVELIADIQ